MEDATKLLAANTNL